MKRILRDRNQKKTYPLFHALIAVAACLILVTIIQWDRGLFKAEFREGDVALRDIFAPYDFNIKGDMNIKATEKLKEVMAKFRSIRQQRQEAEKKAREEAELKRQEAEAKLKLARETLKGIVTLRQEAVLLANGVLE